MSRPRFPHLAQARREEAAARMHLGFDHHRVAILGGDLLGLVGGVSNLPWRHRDAVAGQEFFGLVLV